MIDDREPWRKCSAIGAFASWRWKELGRYDEHRDAPSFGLDLFRKTLPQRFRSESWLFALKLSARRENGRVSTATSKALELS